MAYDEGLATRIRETLEGAPDIVEKKMFGGAGYLANGNMAVGIHGDDLIVRVAAEATAELLARPHVRPFDITGKPMKGWLLVGPEALGDDAAFADWIGRGVAYARSLPPK